MSERRTAIKAENCIDKAIKDGSDFNDITQDFHNAMLEDIYTLDGQVISLRDLIVDLQKRVKELENK